MEKKKRKSERRRSGYEREMDEGKKQGNDGPMFCNI